VEAVAVTDDTLRVHDAVRSVTDDAGITDDTIPVKSILVTVTDPVGVTDDTLRVAPAVRSVTDPVAVTDTTIGSLLFEVVRPASDVSTAGWDTAPTGSQPLWEQLDEAVASDTDYIFAEAP